MIVLLLKSTVNEYLTRIIWFLMVMINEADKMCRLCKFSHKFYITLWMRLNKPLQIVILFKIKRPFSLAFLFFKLLSTTLQRPIAILVIETVVILEKEKNHFKENMFDMLCTKMNLLLFMNLKEIKVISKLKHLIDMILHVNIVHPQFFYHLSKVIDLIRLFSLVLVQHLVTIQKNYHSLC